MASSERGSARVVVRRTGGVRLRIRYARAVPALRAAARACAVSGQGGATFRRSYRQLVVASHARSDSRNVGPIDVNGDRCFLAYVADTVDVAGRREAAHVTGLVGAAPGGGKRFAFLLQH